MIEIAGYLCALLVGVSLGALGMGGSILTIPIMVYLMHIPPMEATGYSLFVVGLTSSVGGAKYIRRRLVDVRTALIFAIPSILAVFFTRTYIVPGIPDIIIQTSAFTITKDLFILLFFSVLMMVIGLNMILKKELEEETEKDFHLRNYLWLTALGLLSGLLTGILGVGGGFIIIPSLVLLAKTPIRMSIGTSLIIIAVNSFIGFAGELITRHAEMDYRFLCLFAFFSALGIFIGFGLASKIVSSRLKKIFGWIVFLIGVCIFIKEIFIR